ncbi:MAG: phospholipid carrier-dependent glycosyltransferase [Gammaproteobacteria bacterium]|nr:MAG: phospholipid carrier-dependent glycosyltransferase [Gammaproteobacteria bacterium]
MTLTFNPVYRAIILIASTLAIRALLMYWGHLEMHFDEAQYWEWSRVPDWGYYSKGPLVAWLIAASEYLFGHGEWQTRLPAWLASGIFMWLIYRFTLTVWKNQQAATWALLLVILNPIYFLLGGVMTTDILLFVFFSWGIWAAIRIVQNRNNKAWLEFGAAVGLGCLTKLSMLLLPFAFALILLINRSLRPLLAGPLPWLSAMVCLILVLPMLLWNAAHDWVLFRHELGHVTATKETVYSLPVFMLEQISAFLPLFYLSATLFYREMRTRLRSHHGSLLLGISAIILIFFVFKSISGKVQINWPAPAYLGMLIAFSGLIPSLAPKLRAGLVAILALMAILQVLVFFPQLLSLKQKAAPFKEMRVWQAPIKALADQAGSPDFIIADSYKLAGELAFYWPEHIPVYVAGNPNRRHNQHDLWPSINHEIGGSGLYVDLANAPPSDLGTAFEHCVPLKAVPAIAQDGTTMRTLHAYRCTGYKAHDWPKPKGY